MPDLKLLPHMFGRTGLLLVAPVFLLQQIVKPHLLLRSNLTSPRHARNPASSKGTSSRRKQCTSTIIARSKIIGFYHGESPCSQNNASNKTIARHNQLREELGFSPCKIRL
jgi:hypothetical protein